MIKENQFKPLSKWSPGPGFYDVDLDFTKQKPVTNSKFFQNTGPKFSQSRREVFKSQSCKII